MKPLKEIKCYQTVLWGNTQVGHFNVEKIDKLRDEKMQIHLEDGIVYVSQGDLSVMIPVTNVAYMIEAQKPKAVAKAK